VAEPRVPVTLLTGFLGTGKTTLLNRLIAAPEAGRVAVIVNEAGEVALDSRLVVGTTEDIVELREGCVCCTVRGDLAVAVARLLARRRAWFRPLRFDRIVVECSGQASPGPVVQTFLLDPTLAAGTRVDGVVALASAPDVERHLAEYPEASEQLGYADRVVLNHCDRVDEAGLLAAEAAVRAVNPAVPMERTIRAAASIPALLDLGGHDPTRWGLGREETGHVHTAGVRHVVLRTDSAVDLGRLKLFLQFVAARRTWNVVRMKGILRCEGLARAVVVHGVHEWLELGPGPMDPPEHSVLLLIGRGLDPGEVERGWQAVLGSG
jgi:G3E family GTPase